jgi:hypothetical protein
MSAKRFVTWSLFGIILVAAAALALPAQAASTPPQAEIPSSEPACNACHDNLYYMYDNGKAYCVAEARGRCVDCHGGDPAALDKATAHAGMAAHPVTDGDISSCQNCHPQDYDARIQTFGDIAGYSTGTWVSQASYQFAPPEASETTAPEMDVEETSWTAKILLGLAALLVFAGGLAISKFLGH